MSALAERWRFLRPWCAPLRNRVALQPGSGSSLGPAALVSVQVRLPTRDEGATSEQLRFLLDALVLLAMVARVDCDAWRHVLTAHCQLRLPDKDTRSEHMGDLHDARFVFELEEAFQDQDWATSVFLDLGRSSERSIRGRCPENCSV